MAYDPLLHHRRSIRLRHYNYAWPGVYFVTTVVRRRWCLFGEITDGNLLLNSAGQMVVENWLALPARFPFCEAADFVVMPNHFHGLLIFHSADHTQEEPKFGPPQGTLKDSLGRVMQAMKSLTTNDYIRGVHENNWQPFEKKLWLRNYWDRVVRDEDEWLQARQYIADNPANWVTDKHHPDENLRLRRLAGLSSNP